MKKIVTGIALSATLCAAMLSYYVLVQGGFAERSRLGAYFALGDTNTLDLSHLDEWNQVVKDKYGPSSSTAIRTATGGGTWEAYVQGKVVETKAMTSTVSSTYGVFMVAQKRKDSFPFEVSIDPKHIPDQDSVTENIKRNFVGKIPARALEFDAHDWRLAHCHSPDAPDFDFPFSKSSLRVGATDVCLIRLNAEGSGTFLIGYAAVYGDVWTRLFSRRICRDLSASWIQSMLARPNVKRPDYVGCVLAHRLSGEAETSEPVLSPHFYEIRGDKTLAAFN